MTYRLATIYVKKLPVYLAQNRVIWRIKRKNRSNGLACRRVQKPKKCSKFRTGGVYISLIWGAKTPGRTELKFVWW